MISTLTLYTLYTLALTLATGGGAAAAAGNLDAYSFADFKLAFGKSYGSAAEEGARKAVFDAALAEARAHNAKFKKGEI
jgi:hypothetical protein